MSRSHGEGTILQRKDGRWQASLMIDGQRRTVYAKTRREAVKKLTDLRQQAAGGLPDPGKRTLSDLLAAWLETASPTLRPKTIHNYQRLCGLHILPTLGPVKLTRLEPVRIERMLAGIQAQGHGRTAQHVYAVLHQACDFGLRWRWLSENPLDRVQHPAHRAARKDVWTQEQLQTFIEGSREHWLHSLWYTLVASGCRVGELLALTWGDVGFDTGTLHIDKTLQRLAGKVAVGRPKTEAGQRTIALPAEAMKVLKAQRGRQALQRIQAGEGWQNERDLVFTGLAGQPLHVSTVEHALRRECERLGVPALTPHGLRHLHASLLLAEGAPLPVVSSRLGHANTQVTASVYAHAVRGQDDGAQAIERALGGRR